MIIKIGEYYVASCYANKYDKVILSNDPRDAKQFTKEEARLWLKLLKNSKIY